VIEFFTTEETAMLEHLDEDLRPRIILFYTCSRWLSVLTERGMGEDVDRLIEFHYNEF
jgi:hypothetical protein